MQKVNWNRSQITTRAWELVREEFLTFSQAMETAWHEAKVETVLSLLKTCKSVTFSFRKTSGEVVTRTGTTFEPQLYAYNQVPKGLMTYDKESYKRYMDVNKAEDGIKNPWGQFKLSKLVAVKGYEYV